MERKANRIFDKKRIKLFEAFSGIGTQKMALEILAKELGLEIETVGYSEIDKFAIKSYMHVEFSLSRYICRWKTKRNDWGISI